MGGVGVVSDLASVLLVVVGDGDVGDGLVLGVGESGPENYPRSVVDEKGEEAAGDL